jgi:Calpain family cysteine protease
LANGQMEAQYTTVDRRIATLNGQAFGAQTNGVIWTALAERAYAQWREWRGTGESGYNLIGNGDSIGNPLQYVTGRAARYISVAFSQITSALQSGQAVTAATNGNDTSLFVGNHAYSITNAYTASSGEQRVIVRNPWGFDNYGGQRGQAIVGMNDGFLDVSFSEFQRSFINVAVA